jgi:hypothetical protein
MFAKHGLLATPEHYQIESRVGFYLDEKWMGG